MTKLEKILAIALVAAIGTIAVVGESNRALKGQITAQRQFIEQREAVIDSLHSELFNANCVIGRVELSLEHLNEVEPKAFIEYSRYFDHETE